MKKNILFQAIAIVLMCFSSCTKFVQVSPPNTQLSNADVFSSDLTATSSVVGTYTQMMVNSGFASGGVSSITFLSGLYADELTNFNPEANTVAFYKNALTPSNTILGPSQWNDEYTYIYSSNAVLAGLAASTGITDSTKRQLEGEVRFIRAFCNFYLVNLFGDIPLATSTDYQVNGLLPRSPTAQVYDSIISDLKSAQQTLPDDYNGYGSERIRPTTWAATAMLARVYLYTQNWTAAEDLATATINNTGLFTLLPDLNSIFLKNSQEAIWQLMPVQAGQNTQEGYYFIVTDYPQYATLSPQLLNAFEPNDQRRVDWVDSIIVSGQTFYYPFKYKVRVSEILTEYSMVLRLAEQYLIRSEARTHLNKLTEAADDLNAIRIRAGLPVTTASDQSSMLAAIQHERQIELNTEWGHRWFDLKRTGQATAVLGPIKGSEWQATDTLYPLPQVDISRDPNLTQNPGY